MSNNHEITINDFENICRTCLSRDNLKPLYEKASHSACLAEMLIFCTVVKFAEDDGLPVKICTNCINEINQAFSFAKRCETTDAVLRKCINIKAELENNLSETVEVKDEIKIETSEVSLHRTVQEVEKNYEFVAVKKEEEVIIEDEYCETYDGPADECYEKDDDQDSTNSQVEKEGSKEEDGVSSVDQLDLLKPCERREENAYSTESRLFEEHTAIHEENVLCSICGKGFESKCHLEFHLKSHTNPRPNVCHVCGKAFHYVGHLNVHKVIHTGEKPHVCSVCSKTFTHFSSLKRHMRIHNRDKSFTCTVCNEAFSHYSSYKRHKELYTGQKPYSCKICGQIFCTNAQFTFHKLSHTGEKPYACSVCGKAFILQSKLNEHMRIHTGDKPFTCTVCNDAFSHRSSMKRHMNIHTRAKSYTCGICCKVFIHHANLERHMKMNCH